jgi:hypothetical protein
MKTFEQREAEYAQARLRILGSAHPASNDEVSSLIQEPNQPDETRASKQNP